MADTDTEVFGEVVEEDSGECERPDLRSPARAWAWWGGVQWGTVEENAVDGDSDYQRVPPAHYNTRSPAAPV